MIVTFTLDPAAVEAGEGDDGGRTIRGVAVPWNTVGTVADGTRVRFAPGSLPADARPIVTLGHTGPPIGRTSGNVDTGAGMETAVRVSRVRDGDDALTLAADGVLGMFSVGVNPIDFDVDDDGVMTVTSGEWHHTALLPFGAFSDAVVTDVAAAQPPPTTGASTMTDTETAAPAPQITLESAPDGILGASGGTPAPVTVPVRAGRPVPPPLTIDRLASLVASANRGEITTDAVRAAIQAALTNVTTTNVAEVVQPAYRAEISGLIDHGSPFTRALSQAPLPAAGMTIEYPEWVTKPTTGVQATEKTAIVSTPVDLGMGSAPVITIAGGNDISLQAVERSSPSFLAAYLRAAAVDWSRRAETYAINRILTGATAVPPGADFLANVQALMGALSPETTPPGPLFLAMAYNVALPLIGVTTMDGPAWWDGSLNFGDAIPNATGGGLNMFVDWNLPADTMVLGSSQGATWHQSAGAPADIRVIDVSLLGLDVGVYGYVCLTVEYPAAFAKMDVTP